LPLKKTFDQSAVSSSYHRMTIKLMYMFDLGSIKNA